ncbi:MAG: nitrate reductase cytochrome c-type subunit [Gammaproteobacteria bacterium]|nr:nitrate reductase cytochrome c-type subunit [Gammaproteobacteria bacterium]MCW9032303.1 nitrate reductase cytochrome c-type subunit [Gammaproteobacteria bacterium]
MRRSTVINIAMMLSLGLLSNQAFAGDVNSLRGANPLSDAAKEPAKMTVQDDREPITRDYVQQPPLIPHKTKGYRINIKFNKCLTCHSWANYKEAGATKISQTHFSDRENNVLANIAPRRYFCTQCHVTQVDAAPLVENTFNPLKTIKH